MSYKSYPPKGNHHDPYLEFVDCVLADDVLEVDDVLVLEPRQHLHLAQRPLAERLRGQ